MVKNEHFRKAISQALQGSQENLRKSYHDATNQRDDRDYKTLLSACVKAKTDSYGYFLAKDIVEPLSKITGVQKKVTNFSRALNRLTTKDFGEILIFEERRGKKYFKLRNPLMRPFLLMKNELSSTN